MTSSGRAVDLPPSLIDTPDGMRMYVSAPFDLEHFAETAPRRRVALHCFDRSMIAIVLPGPVAMSGLTSAAHMSSGPCLVTRTHRIPRLATWEMIDFDIFQINCPAP